MMRTTISLDDRLLKTAKKAAAERGISLTKLVEQALRDALARRPTAIRELPPLPRSSECGPARPGIDLNDNSALRDLDLL